MISILAYAGLRPDEATRARWRETAYRGHHSSRTNSASVIRDWITWTCRSDPERPLARAILADTGIDVERSLEFFAEHGGFCDCEILLNIAGRDDLDDQLRTRVAAVTRSRDRIWPCASPSAVLALGPEARSTGT
ncbi:MAG TPA: DUF2695 domain-containing protein [Solirubrobacteraceae bacterium]|nr:DUF2695 domain-containing protein [Solirubrobacteraceae bacterium]